MAKREQKVEEPPKKEKKYKIIVNYDTGDSFGQYPDQETECIEEWNDLEAAKENLLRIQEHNRAYKKINGWGHHGKGEWKDYNNERWYCTNSPEFSIMLSKDDGTLYQECCGWVGYFETMNYAEVRQNKDDMRVYAN